MNPRGPHSACLLRSTQPPREESWRSARWYLAQERASNIHLASLAVVWCLGRGGEEAAPTPAWVPARTPASAPAHLATGSPGAPSSPRASEPFAGPFSAAPLPAHFPACLALGLRWVSGRRPSLARRLSGGLRRRNERRLLELRERGAGGSAWLQLPAAGGRSGCCLLLWLPRPQVLLRRPAQLLPLRAQLHVVAQVQALALTSP